MNKQDARHKIEQLVQRFTDQIESYSHPDYNETLTRRDFIDPFFKALGWDVDNENGYAESYREVIHEDRLKVGESLKAPDYSFRLVGGKRLFFVEAKKPSVVVKDEIPPAYQIRRYGWSAKMPVSIITDFQEFAVYDCTKKPKPTDKASVARVKYLTFKDYLTEFDFIWETFSKEQVLKGSFDQFIKSDTHKKGTATVDKEFLQSLDNWRTYLATSISWNNKELDEDEINFVVQQTIDRIIFLRIAEDRGVEHYGNLKTALKQGDLYQNLFHLFENADDKYNSGLFDFKKDRLSKHLKVDNKIIKNIINELYYPECPYEFSVLPVEILGSAYEQFLGKQIRIDKAHRARIEEKPEVRKAGGVYYTPQYIVDYIVKNTVGKLVEGKTPEQVSTLKIVDPACGSGSFLIGAYQFLLDWHKDYYSENGKPSKGKKSHPLTPDGSLTTAEKKRILLNNIYGVDIDVNAVEVTKLSLLLKCLEGETEASIASQLKLFNERVLPTLDDNIKSGNSLIDIDFYSGELEFEIERKIKPFRWEKAFPMAFKITSPAENTDFKLQYHKVKKLNDDTEDLLNKYIAKDSNGDYALEGGFDIVLGNPPYGVPFSSSESGYFKKRFQTAVWRIESYLLFIEQGLRILKSNGILGFIIPDTLLNLGFTEPTRELLLRNSKLNEIIRLPSTVFSGATVDTIILLTEKLNYTNKYHHSHVSVKTFGKKQVIRTIESPQREFYVQTGDWYDNNAFNLQTLSHENALLSKIEFHHQQIGNIAKIFSGIKVYEVGKGTPPQSSKIRDEKPFTSKIRIAKTWNPLFDGKDIGRFSLLWKKDNWINYGVWLAAPRNLETFNGEKILIRKITAKTLIATYVSETSYCNTLLFVLKLTNSAYSYKSVLAILNSLLIGWYFRNKFQISDDDTFPQIMIRDILQFPIPEINKSISHELEKLVDQLLQLNHDKQEINLSASLEQLESKIDHCESRINELVYRLYELTPEEIKIVEDSVAGK